MATGLESDAGAAEVHALIWQRYAPLVQEGTMFWNASGLRFHAGLFSGAQLDLESLAALLTPAASRSRRRTRRERRPRTAAGSCCTTSPTRSG